MNRLIIVGGITVAVVGLSAAALGSGDQGKAPVAAVQSFKCLDMGGTVTSSGAAPSVICHENGDKAELQVTTAPVAESTAPSAASTIAPTTTVARPENTSNSVRVNTSQSDTQSAQSGSVTIDQNTSSSDSRGNATNTSTSTTNISISN